MAKTKLEKLEPFDQIVDLYLHECENIKEKHKKILAGAFFESAFRKGYVETTRYFAKILDTTNEFVKENILSCYLILKLEEVEVDNEIREIFMEYFPYFSTYPDEED